MKKVNKNMSKRIDKRKKYSEVDFRMRDKEEKKSGGKLLFWKF